MDDDDDDDDDGYYFCMDIISSCFMDICYIDMYEAKNTCCGFNVCAKCNFKSYGACYVHEREKINREVQCNDCGEIATAKRSLECARKWEQSTKVALESARQQLKEAEKNAKDAKDQVRDAELHLKSVEKVCLNNLLHMCITL